MVSHATEQMYDGLATLAGAGVGTLGSKLVLGESLTDGLLQSFVVFGGQVALSCAAADVVAPRIQTYVGDTALGSNTVFITRLAIHGAVGFVVNYATFGGEMQASLMVGAAIAAASVVGDYVYDMQVRNPNANQNLQAAKPTPHAQANAGMKFAPGPNIHR